MTGVLDYLINALWQAPLLGLGAWALTRIGGLSPVGRHRVWLICLALSVTLPAMSLRLPSMPVHAVPRAVIVADAIPTIETDGPLVAAAVPHADTTMAPAVKTALEVDPRVAWGLAALFAAVVALGFGRLFLSWLAVRKLVGGAQSVTLPDGVQADLKAFMRARHRRMPRIRQTAQVASPAVAGVFAATVLVPEAFTQRPDAELRAALLHEFAHVVRRDYAINLVCETLALPLWWHPAAHLMLAEVRRTRELVCDALASTAMRSERAYAQSLISLAGAIQPRLVRGAPVAVGLFGKSMLEERLMHLIGPKRSTGPALKALGLIGGGLMAAGVVGATTLLHVNTALAQTEAPPPPPPPAMAVTPAPPAPPTPPSIAEMPTPPAPPAPPAAPQAISDDTDDGDNVVIENGHGRHHKHKWVSASGRSFTIFNDEDGDLTPEQQAKLEKDIAKATEKAAAAEAMVNSPEFKAKIAEATAKAARAEAYVNSAEFKAKIAEATAKAAKAEAFVNSPEFRARIAEATAKAAKAEAMVNSPEFKAKIDRAQRFEQSPEWRKAEEDLRRAEEHLRAVEEQERDR
ncbi:MAG TPA: M56 family metallopeptidase [Caulobacteraceae bacterium]|jgi:beta-lactamase regulating signal transducer with metallopeptidase domain|nr:M56 family metallopeptidase [Caulobacteraceae bacterium]